MATTNTTKSVTLAANTIRIRMYRIGFGDCFLLSLPVPDCAGADSHRHILFDCGVHARGDLDMIEQAVDDIARTSSKKLAIVVATHSHQDHISGFSDKFTSFEISEVWLPWCENPKDKQALKLQKKHAALAAQLQTHFRAQLKAAPRPGKLRTAAVAAIDNLVGDLEKKKTALVTNATAMSLLRGGFGVNARVRYLEAGGSLANPGGIDGLSVNILGPPRDEKFLAKMDPPAGQSYLTTKNSERLNAVEPFAERWRMAANDPALRKLRFSDDEADKFQKELASASLDGLAFALDQAKNNTSLVTLLAFRGQYLLFPGDAQYGNWKFWLDQDDAAAILSNVTFFKVAHHGSHNATPKDALEKMSKGKFAAMLSTQNVPWDSIPRLPLLDRLNEQTKNRVLRSDSLAIKDRPDAPKGPSVTNMPTGFQKGDFWYDYLIKL